MKQEVLPVLLNLLLVYVAIGRIVVAAPPTSVPPLKYEHISPQRTFVLKQFVKVKEDSDDVAEHDQAEHVWLYDTHHSGKRVLLPIPPLDGDQNFFFSNFDISLDERYIFIERKVCSGTNSMFLFRRVRPLYYKRVGDDQATAIFQQVGRRHDLQSEPGVINGVIHLIRWQRRSAVCSFYTRIPTNKGHLGHIEGNIRLDLTTYRWYRPIYAATSD